MRTRNTMILPQHITNKNRDSSDHRNCMGSFLSRNCTGVEQLANFTDSIGETSPKFGNANGARKILAQNAKKQWKWHAVRNAGCPIYDSPDVFLRFELRFRFPVRVPQKVGYWASVLRKLTLPLLNVSFYS